MHDFSDLEIRDKLNSLTFLEISFEQPLLQHINIFDLLDEFRYKSNKQVLHFTSFSNELRVPSS